MNRAALVAWTIAAIALVAALVDLVIRPMHWERTLGVALVVLVIAAVIALRQGRRVARD